jgi:hypothetical protein
MSLRARLFVAVVLPALLMCGSAAPRAAAGIEPLRLTVVNSADTAMELPGVEVSFVAADGSIHVLGRTNDRGRLDIDKDVLRSGNATVILCCLRPAFFCGAMRVQEERLLEYDEYLIAIAPAVVR